VSQLPVAEPYLEPERRTWPLVVGILASLWGGIGAVSNVLALGGAGRESQPAFMRGGLGTAMYAVGALLSLALLSAGVQLIRRRASGVQLMRAWVPLALIVQLSTLATMVTHRDEFEQAFREQMEREAEARAQKSGQAAPNLPAGFEKLMYGLALGCGGVSAVVPPAVVAFFVFGRRGREALAEWQRPA
jgi:hypothetical protein